MTVSVHEKRSSGSQEGQKTQGPKEKYKRRSTKHTHKTKLFLLKYQY